MANIATSSWLPWLAVAVYGGVRLALLPDDDPTLGGCGHDAAYIILVAQNLLDGRGYVNDAHWLVFLQPDSLPMPYHNANPLYPTAVAAWSYVTRMGVVQSGFAVSALAHVLLLAGLYVLAGKYTACAGKRCLLAAAGAFFPPVFVDSLAVVPDCLCTACTVWGIVLLVPPAGKFAFVGSGIGLGLAWLARSSAMLIGPALLLYLIMKQGWKTAAVRLAGAGLVAGVVASPWLLHTYQVWGHPLRSDAAYYLLEVYHARDYRDDVERYWHSTKVPPGLGEVARQDPAGLATWVVKGVPRAGYRTAILWSEVTSPLRDLLGSRGLLVVGALLGFLTLATFWYAVLRLRNDAEIRRLFLPDFLAALVYGATLVLIFAFRADTLEIRYFSLLSIFLAMFLMYGAIQSWELLKECHLAKVVLAGSSLLWLGLVPYRDGLLAHQKSSVNTETAAYHALAWRVASRDLCKLGPPRVTGKGPVVVGTFPYHFTQATRRPSLSIPESDDAYLKEYMTRYGAEYVFLTKDEIAFWRPAWLEPEGVPAWLEPVRELVGGVLYRRKGAP